MLDQQERLLKLRVRIMRDSRFGVLSGIMMTGACKFTDEVPTAATNGLDVLINKQFFASLSDEEAIFLLTHEYYHVLLMHMVNYTDLIEENAQLANIAMDLCINLMLDDVAGRGADGFLRVPDMALLDRQYADLSTREIFFMLKKSGQQGKGKGKPKSASGKDGQQIDEHRPAGGDAEGDGEATPGAPLSAQQAKEVMQQVDSAVRQAAQMAGRTGASIDRLVAGLLEAVVPWEEQLREFVKQQSAGSDMSTWRKLSRRWMARDIKQPSHYTERMGRITIGIDTSSSIGDEQLRRALSEIKTACESVNPDVVDVIYWDHVVQAHEMYEGDNVQTLVDATKPRGGGGTRAASMLEYMQAKDIKPDCVVMFTDGYCEHGFDTLEWPAPIMWCISTKGIVPATGKSIYVPA